MIFLDPILKVQLNYVKHGLITWPKILILYSIVN